MGKTSERNNGGDITMEITLYYDDQFKPDRTEYSSATITRFKSAKAFWREMNNDKRFIQVDDHKRRLGDDEFTKYIQKDRIIEIWIEKEM